MLLCLLPVISMLNCLQNKSRVVIIKRELTHYQMHEHLTLAEATIHSYTNVLTAARG